jgi:mRNA interferase RelE/StbE
MYQVEFLPKAAEDFAKLDQAVADRVLKRLRWLAENFDSVKPESLTGPFSGLLKLPLVTTGSFTRPTERGKC